MIADKLLQCLHKVKQTGKDRWSACCPAHDQKTPSLSLREPDNHILLQYAICITKQVMQELFSNKQYDEARGAASVFTRLLKYRNELSSCNSSNKNPISTELSVQSNTGGIQ